VCIKIEAVTVDRTIVKPRPDSTGALKSGRQPSEDPTADGPPKQMVAEDARTAIALSLSSGKAHEGRKLFASLG
jgi:hypothetical protein